MYRIGSGNVPNRSVSLLSGLVCCALGRGEGLVCCAVGRGEGLVCCAVGSGEPAGLLCCGPW